MVTDNGWVDLCIVMCVCNSLALILFGHMMEPNLRSNPTAAENIICWVQVFISSSCKVFVFLPLRKFCE